MVHVGWWMLTGVKAGCLLVLLHVTTGGELVRS